MFVFWDIDGTLMTCGGDGTKALNRTFLDLYGIDGAFTGRGVGSAMDSVLLGNIMKTHGIAEDDRVLIESVYFTNLKKNLTGNPYKTVLPGVINILDHINSKDGWYNLLLTSNLKEAARIKLDSVGLWQYFSAAAAGGFGDSHGEKWDVLSSVLEELSVQAGRSVRSGEVLIIGDSVYDIRTAKQLGVGYIAVASGWTSKGKLEEEHLKHRLPVSVDRTPETAPLAQTGGSVDELSAESARDAAAAQTAARDKIPVGAEESMNNTASQHTGLRIEVLLDNLADSDIVIDYLETLKENIQ